jgi:nucleoside-diphosphate-sugar epimerase
MNPESLKKAMDGCSQAFHTAAFARVWDRDVASIYRQNIQGTMNVVNSGLQAGVERLSALPPQRAWTVSPGILRG